ncbi:PEP-CTERM sorting domain-containing protein [Phragmitibacter flavus]|uniref:PEP-CTERM sorting domain-containing protein n=1 Tax=Phragmitibacter flavus TaxID=2576071 RepID=UPI00140D3061|nr:PEP-CTERM sorting domain-containing protein [Phragmitibacter flavus]
MGPYFDGTTLNFTDIAPASGQNIDLRLTVTDVIGNYQFIGSFPNYKQGSSNEPNGDLGYFYEHLGGAPFGAGGLTYNLDFFEGGTNFTTPFTIPLFRLMIYDVDGEAVQSEGVRVFEEDGFVAYQLPTIGGISVTENAGDFLFTGPGTNRAEDDPSGAFILIFADTSSIRLQMEANTTSGNSANGIFSAIDGDLSLFNGNTDDFDDPVPTPEPSSALLLAVVGVLGIMHRKRPAC